MSKKAWFYITLLALGLVILVAPVAPVSAQPVERVFHLTAEQFAYNPSILHVNPGDQVTIVLSAIDVVHGLAVDGYNVEMASDPGQTARVRFTADKPGVYRFRCTVTCGNMHPFMIGTIQVGGNAFYWRVAGLAVLSLMVGVWKLRK